MADDHQPHFDMETDIFTPISSPERFVVVDSDEKEHILQGLTSQNTKLATKKAVKAFSDWLSARGMPLDFCSRSKSQLNELLQSFWMEARSQKKEKYKTNTMKNFRHGLIRHLQENYDGPIDIIRDSEFAESNKVFKAVTKNLKSIGKGETEHHEPLAEDDLIKIYEQLSDYATSSCRLQYKVMFDIMLHLVRRGRENLRQLTKAHFGVATDSAGKRYLYQSIDEATKNHQDDENRARGRMYEITGSTMCPVITFELYLSKLDQGCDILFQQPRRHYSTSDDRWYDAKAVGQNTLGNMMPRISSMCGLSRRYTNHCLRATAITLLDNAEFPSRHIMTVTGHRSEASIKSYNHHTNEATKRKMSYTLTQNLGIDNSRANISSDVSREISKSASVTVSDDSTPLATSMQHALLPVPRSPLAQICLPQTESQSPLLTVSQQQMFDILGADDISDELLSTVPLSPMMNRATPPAVPGAPQIYATNSTVNIHYHFHS